MYLDVVDLIVEPKEEMTWEMWKFATLGIGSFVQKWEYVELSFDVVVTGVGMVATGKLVQEEGNHSDG